jgi:hypothetical protein
MPLPAEDRLKAALADRYAIQREIGEGGMATVYLADDLKHGRKVALKVLKPELAAVVGSERFLTEIKTTANLQHPHAPLTHEPSPLFHAMQGGVERAFLDEERLVGRVADPIQDLEAAEGLPVRQSPEDQVFERPLEDVQRFSSHPATSLPHDRRASLPWPSCSTPWYCPRSLCPFPTAPSGVPAESRPGLAA